MKQLALAALLLPAMSSGTPVCQAQAPTPLALTDVSIVDVRDGSIRSNQTVLIEGQRISSIAPTDEVQLSANAEILDGEGGFLIPGLWDMHVHTFNNNDLQPPNAWTFPLYLANGVTGVRDMFVKPGEQAEQLRVWQEEIEAGTFVGPRFGDVGTLVDGTPPIHNSDTVTTVVQAQAFVNRLKETGIDFVKVYNRLSPEAYHALVDAAREASLYVAGHVPSAISITDASEAGQRSVEHLDGVHYACSSEEDSLRVRRVPNPYHLAREFVATHEPGKCAALYEQLAANETWQAPTFTALRPWASLNLAALTNDEGMVYMPVEEAAEWQGLRDFLSFAPPPVKQGMADLYALEQRIVREMYNAGVPLLAGTDIGNSYIYPGFSLIEELEIFVEAGLPALAALQTATLNPAVYFDRTLELGTVAEGNLADLVLLNANPLEDIGNLRHIRAVVANGNLYARDELELMKQEVLVNNYREALSRPNPLSVQTANSETLQQYVGTYLQEGRDSQVKVLLQDGGLRIRFDDWVDIVESLGGTLFRVQDSNVVYIFQTDDEGAVWGFEMNDGDRVVTFRRTDS